MFKAPDHNSLVDLVSQYIISSYDGWIHDAVREEVQYERRKRSFSARDKAQDEREPMPFTGDNADKPPLAWVTIWKGTYSNLYGGWIAGFIQEWGYIMWDADRLTSSGAIEVLEREWEEWHTEENGDFHDPRYLV
jgi:hypothetical protein